MIVNNTLAPLVKTDEVVTSPSAYQLYKALNKDSFVLAYTGVFDDMLTSILMDLNDCGKFESKSSRKKISFLIAECFQNIVRHSNEDSKEAVGFHVPEMFLLRQRNSLHHLVTTNAVRSKDSLKLKESIDHLKTLSKDELKALYLDVFNGGGLSEKGGAGLGLIEMARKSGTAPTYQFENLGGDFSNFFFQVNVLPADFQGEVTSDKTDLAPSVKIYELLTQNNIVLLQKGDFTKESILPLIQLFQSNLSLKAEDAEVMKRVITLLMELLENINEHASEVKGAREGIFFVAEPTPGKYEIFTGNFIPVAQSLILRERLDNILKLFKDGNVCPEQLEKLSDGEKFSPGNGLLEISKNSKGKLSYEFKPIGHSLTYFSLRVCL